MRSPRLLPPLLCAALAACSYQYTNPAEALRAGEVRGRVLYDPGAGVEPAVRTTVASTQGRPSFLQRSNSAKGSAAEAGGGAGRSTRRAGRISTESSSSSVDAGRFGSGALMVAAMQ